MDTAQDFTDAPQYHKLQCYARGGRFTAEFILLFFSFQMEWVLIFLLAMMFMKKYSNFSGRGRVLALAALQKQHDEVNKKKSEGELN